MKTLPLPTAIDVIDGSAVKAAGAADGVGGGRTLIDMKADWKTIFPKTE